MLLFDKFGLEIDRDNLTRFMPAKLAFAPTSVKAYAAALTEEISQDSGASRHKLTLGASAQKDGRTRRLAGGRGAPSSSV